MSQEDSGTNMSNNSQCDKKVFHDVNHTETILKLINNQRANNKYCDVKIKVNDTEFPCHKNVLAEASPELAKMLELAESNEILDINSIDADTMESLLNFMYLGTIGISARNAKEIFLASEFLKIASVQNEAVKTLQSNIDFSNCLELYILAQRYNCADLEKEAFLFAVKNFDKIWHSNDFLNLNQQQLINLLSNDEIRVVTDEKFVFWAAQRWFIEHPKKDTSLIAVMETVRFHLMDTQFLQNCCELFPTLKLSPEVIERIKKAKTAPQESSIITLNECKKFSNSLPTDKTVDVIVVGYNSYVNNSVCCYQEETNSWFYLPDHFFPGGDLLHVVYADNQVYAIRNEGMNFYLCQFDEKFGLWQDVSGNIPDMKHIDGLLFLDQHLYVVGRSDPDYLCEAVVAQGFNFESKKWFDVGTFNKPAKAETKFISNGRNFYMAGGTGYLPHSSVSDFQAYNPIGNMISTLPDLSVAKAHVGGCVLGNFIYIIGGWVQRQVGTDFEFLALNHVERYNIKNNCWQEVSPTIEARYNPQCIVKDSKIYVFHGIDKNDRRISSVECYDPLMDEWKIISDMPEKLTLYGCFKLKVPETSLLKIVK